MSKDFKSIKEIEIGSYWYAASGEQFGVRVMDKDLEHEDIIVEWFKVIDGVIIFEEGTHDIDWFKLQYRYYQKE